ncbi:MAG: alcohol dehydrogenase catalytic domain-containing protein, partial [Actinobacteria bacterium]|nr:alcohol dehydrogenase catalytic domain-containing protein [Actinomycetota bacterium]
GARVTIDPTVACGDCASCQSGLPQVCTRGSYLGMTATGTMADYITVAADRVVALPDTVSDAAATVLEPVAVALHLLDRVAGFALPSMRAHVIGGGPLGVLLGQTLTARGWAVTIHEPNEYRRAIAAACGLAVEESTGPVLEGPVLVVETSAAAAGVQVARELARPGSVVAFVGRAPADFTTAEILLGELSLLGIRAGVGHYPAAIELVASGAVTPEAIITHEFALASASEAFTSVIDPARRVMRAVLTV